MKVITIGGATYDVFIDYTQAEMLHRPIDRGQQSFLLLPEGQKLEIDSVEYQTGGGATNSAVSFARLGFNATPVCVVGIDYQAQTILEALHQEQVATDHIARIPQRPTSISFIIASPSGDRTVLVYRGASSLLSEQQIPATAIAQTDVVYITSLNGQAIAVLPYVVQLAKKHNRMVAINPGTTQLKTGIDSLSGILPYVDIFILNSFEATLFMSSLEQTKSPAQLPASTTSAIPTLLQKPSTGGHAYFDVRKFFKKIQALGPSIIAVTNGSEGVYIAHGDELLFHPSLPSNLVSTLGAGDAFGSCFVASIVQGLPTEDALRRGIANSSSVIEHIGAKTGLLTQQELDKKVAGVNPSLLQRFSL